ncbi:hypothetical protein P4H70_23060 [Paenibacillus ehimensis]|uniref:hypothetical protein n=1 Tax=Paenibacillus ehimensis TaxID=79264 RepID=UPI002DBAAD20|nr:hypothetical protein [Paenibacillus ehimensis]MEC0211825.1 hypothetical protein [Paenibacillus ehimensis]
MRQQKRRDMVTQAYMTAVWSRASKLPKLESILSKQEQATKQPKKKRVQTPEQMLEFAKLFQANYEESQK